MTLTDGMLKTVLVGAIFLTLWGGFMLLFVGQQITSQGDDIGSIAGQSWEILTSPELVLINSVFGIIGLIIFIFAVRGMLPT